MPVAYLDDLVPATRNDHGVQQVRAESDTGDPRTQPQRSMNRSRFNTNYHNAPLGMSILLDVEFTFTEGIPELDRPVTGAGNDLPVISAEADRQNIRSMSNEFPGRLAGVQVPKTEGVIPRSGKGELAVRRDDDVRNEVVVSMKNAFWVTKRVLISG